MLMHDRDRLVVLSVGRFGQMTSKQIQQLHFADLLSSTSLKRTLTRLTERRYLSVVERRMAGGSRGGSGQYVFQLGSAGHALSGGRGRYSPMRSVKYHMLAIVDAYLELLRKECEGRLRIDGFATEPDTHIKIAGVDLRPDLHVDVADIHKRRNVEMWIEVDLGTERQEAIKKKLADYWHAYQNWEGGTFPLIVFLAPDDARRKELEWIISRGDPEQRELFFVSTIPHYVSLIFG